ncbi:Mannose-6-phosphate isomerase, type 1 [Giardia muris]|uniref:Mannose-6-phosphate isomerase, type 1 n=1 Tax=Giardia muris TaxID=5742 RepID=A0A4Z1SNH5_GIAMU|nr:Mannose-6-phosphate isomerase, type 1 [Giardia muris]|eukprot:TNJ27180.1 Mannose-6-phosphate isomerase, type 1 [Giardia muris]
MFRFKPIFKQVVWGGDRISAYKGIESTMSGVGESWEISSVSGNESIVLDGPDAGLTLPSLIERHKASLVGKRNYERFGTEFPLLIKLIDAKQDLSVQVHPNDELAEKRHGKRGKTEMWYVIDAKKDAKLLSGFSEHLTPEGYVMKVNEDQIISALCQYDVRPGDVFYLPAGRVHSIGAGVFIAEIQQTSDLTYRIYDFNRKDVNGQPRELHTELAKDAIDYAVQPDYRTHYIEASDTRVELVSCPHFTTSLLDLTKPYTLDKHDLDSFVVVICISGSCTSAATPNEKIDLRQGETILISASVQTVTFTPVTTVKLLLSWLE